MVGEYIKALRDTAGQTQRELAVLAGISPSLLSLIEAGKREPSIKQLRDIARGIGIPSAVLFAAALSEEDESDAPEVARAREMTEHLLSAAQHALFAVRLQRNRDRE